MTRLKINPREGNLHVAEGNVLSRGLTAEERDQLRFAIQIKYADGTWRDHFEFSDLEDAKQTWRETSKHWKKRFLARCGKMKLSVAKPESVRI